MDSGSAWHREGVCLNPRSHGCHHLDWGSLPVGRCFEDKIVFSLINLFTETLSDLPIWYNDNELFGETCGNKEREQVSVIVLVETFHKTNERGSPVRNIINEKLIKT